MSRFVVQDDDYTPENSYSSRDFYTIYDTGRDEDDYRDATVRNKKRNPISFNEKIYAECFAAALNLGWESIRRHEKDLKDKD